MAIAFRAAATGASATGTVTVTIPATVTTGDALLLFAGGYQGFTGFPAGWTVLRTDSGLDANFGAQPVSQYVLWRVAQGGDPLTTATFTGGNAGGFNGVSLLAYSGTDPVTPVHTHGGTGSTVTGLSLTAPSVTTTSINTVIVQGYAVIADTAGANTVTTGATNRTSLSSAAQFAHGTCDQLKATAGPTGTLSATSTRTGAWVAQTVALGPPGVTGGFFF